MLKAFRLLVNVVRQLLCPLPSAVALCLCLTKQYKAYLNKAYLNSVSSYAHMPICPAPMPCPYALPLCLLCLYVCLYAPMPSAVASSS
ncbi:hypothetical protein B484DRAFT_138195 [Ochromonadaceae sp. CCMP2298]|nr:hypothetical protein B484DRAFT_138195 [Ochromonadaceae sp. CCMP2298]